MNIVQVTQNTQEWLDLRKTRIGASDANIIMGVSEYSTPRKLYFEKKTTEAKVERNTFVQDKGHRLEKKLREYIEREFGDKFNPVTVLSDEYPFLMASLDGFSEKLNLAMECKFVGQDNFEVVRNATVLPQYYPQIQQQLLLTGAKACILAVCADDDEEGLKYCYCLVNPDLDYISKELIPAVKKFKKCLDKDLEPELMPSDVLDQSNDNKLSNYVSAYLSLEKELKLLEEKIEATKSEIFKQIKHSNVVVDGVKIQKIAVKDKAIVDYERFINDLELDVPDSFKAPNYESFAASLGLPIPGDYITSKKSTPMRKITLPKPLSEK